MSDCTERSDGQERTQKAGPRVRAAERLRSVDGACRRIAYAVLVAAVRGRRERGGPWGEAVLAEFAMTSGGRESVRWAIGGLRTVWHERRSRWRYLPRFDTPVRRIAGAAVLGILGAVLANQFLFSTRFIPSSGMAPTLRISDRILMDRVGFRLTGIHRDDVVFYTAQVDGGTHSFVKRVVGLPGDVVECRDGRVFRNGTALEEHAQAGAESFSDPVIDCPRTVVPDGKLFVVGDNWQVSMDSRQNGPIPQDAVEGRMLVRVWPLRR